MCCATTTSCSAGRYRRELIKRGVFEMPESLGRSHISAAHTADDIDRSLGGGREALRAAVDALARAVEARARVATAPRPSNGERRAQPAAVALGQAGALQPGGRWPRARLFSASSSCRERRRRRCRPRRVDCELEKQPPLCSNSGLPGGQRPQGPGATVGVHGSPTSCACPGDVRRVLGAISLRG